VLTNLADILAQSLQLLGKQLEGDWGSGGHFYSTHDGHL
jgi:hypothetical protein